MEFSDTQSLSSAYPAASLVRRCHLHRTQHQRQGGDYVSPSASSSPLYVATAHRGHA